MSKFVCKHPWSHFEINNPNGDVTMCCNNNTVLGNVNDASVEEIWNGEKFQAVRKRMCDKGAHDMCPHTCPVLKGGKKYEDIGWYTELEDGGDIRANAELNEREYADGALALRSMPRWFRFAYSYACNLDCYHCYQREAATHRLKLPADFMESLPSYARTAQVVLPFGGEPFFFSPVVDFLEKHNTNLETRFYFITNATLLTDRIFDVLARMPIVTMAVSLDAATAESFDKLRVRGKNANWQMAMDNVVRLRDLKQAKGFHFTVSMTLNSVNALEIEPFVDLALRVDAEPLISLVANPYQTAGFQKDYLHFSDAQFAEMDAQIARSLKKLRGKNYSDAEIYLKELRKTLKLHRAGDNSLSRFKAKNLARKTYHQLPEFLQEPIRAVVQARRTRKAMAGDEE